MIQSVTVTNYLGQATTIELRRPESSGLFVRGPGITGLDPGKGIINTTPNGSSNGSSFNSSRIDKRYITFNLGFLENPTIEATRHNTYKYFPFGRRVDLLIKTDTRSYKTYGYVESNEVVIFSNEVGCVISIVCPDPNLYDLNNQITSLTNLTSLFEFPFSNESLTQDLIEFGSGNNDEEVSILYDGEFDVGCLIRIRVLEGGASNIKLWKKGSSKIFEFKDTVFYDGDDILISTLVGEKTVTLRRNGQTFNLMNLVNDDREWFQLTRGFNIFQQAASTGLNRLIVTIENPIAHEGI